MGLIIGIGVGILAGYDVAKIGQLGMTTAACYENYAKNGCNVYGRSNASC
ncbi:MAG: hypothetical protein ACLTAY_13480 [Thomasclavelia ramosa]